MVRNERKSKKEENKSTTSNLNTLRKLEVGSQTGKRIRKNKLKQKKSEMIKKIIAEIRIFFCVCQDRMSEDQS